MEGGVSQIRMSYRDDPTGGGSSSGSVWDWEQRAIAPGSSGNATADQSQRHQYWQVSTAFPDQSGYSGASGNYLAVPTYEDRFAYFPSSSGHSDILTARDTASQQIASYSSSSSVRPPASAQYASAYPSYPSVSSVVGNAAQYQAPIASSSFGLPPSASSSGYSASSATSRVLHVRNLPNRQIPENDLLDLLIPFGRVKKVLFPKSVSRASSKAALVEMSSLNEAQEVVNYYAANPGYVGGNRIAVQFSTHQTLITDKDIARGRVRSRSPDRGTRSFRSRTPPRTRSPVPRMDTNQLPVPYQLDQEPSRVLALHFHNWSAPVEIDYCRRILEDFGKLVRIVSFSKTPGVAEVLAEMDHIREAIAARQGLDNTIHFDRRSRLIVDFSPTRELSVTGFSRYSRDYTQFDDNGRIIGNAPSRSRSEREEKRRKKDPRDDNPVLLVSNFDEETTTMDVLFNLFSVYGNVIRIKILFGKRDSALIQFETSAFAQNARRCMDNLKLLGKKIRVTTSKYSEIAMPAPEDEEKHLTKEFLNAKYHRYRGESESYQKNLIQPTEVLHVSGVRDITEDQLREAFSNIGTVVKVKKLENHPTMALLEMENTEKAVEALVKLHLTEISGNAIRIAFSPNKVD